MIDVGRTGQDDERRVNNERWFYVQRQDLVVSLDVFIFEVYECVGEQNKHTQVLEGHAPARCSQPRRKRTFRLASWHACTDHLSL